MIFIHKLSDVQSEDIGIDTRIWQYAVILNGAKIGNNCNICAHTFIENDVYIGNNVTIKCGVYIWDGITIEDNVQLGPNVTFTNDKYPRAKQVFKLERTLIKENVSIGAGAVLLGGIKIGQSSMIGAGSVITKDVPPFTLWYGNPAEHKGYVTREGQVLSLNLVDKKGNQYILNSEEPVK
ncbi:MAG: N-acetyltransferase [bacterium]|nr:N-acetyltransferase [bacterium]